MSQFTDSRKRRKNDPFYSKVGESPRFHLSLLSSDRRPKTLCSLFSWRTSKKVPSFSRFFNFFLGDPKRKSDLRRIFGARLDYAPIFHFQGFCFLLSFWDVVLIRSVAETLFILYIFPNSPRICDICVFFFLPRFLICWCIEVTKYRGFKCQLSYSIVENLSARLLLSIVGEQISNLILGIESQSFGPSFNFFLEAKDHKRIKKGDCNN